MAARTLSRTWDAFDAYLFDIDGTLMNCTDAVHYFAFCDALSSVGGRALTIDGVKTHGNTDVGILRDAFAQHGIAEAVWRPQLAGMIAVMGRFVQQREAELNIRVLPQVIDVLRHLKRRGAVLGTATGNLQVIGEAKLRKAGLLDLFDFGGWSDAHETRASVFRAAAAKARGLAGPTAALCVFGDTPADVQAAHENGLEVIAVATGIYKFEDLQSEEPELLLHSLEGLAIESAVQDAAMRESTSSN